MADDANPVTASASVTDTPPPTGIRWLNRRDCLGCETRFYPSRDDAKWCSNACKQQAYRKRKKERT